MSPKTFDIADLSDNLADLLSDIQNHVEVTLTHQGVPLAKVLPLAKPEPTVTKADLKDALKPRVPGFWQGQVKMADDFDETPEELIAAFYGDE
jgi:antitoxin (DNA-binding transcriptional repressor) of toxin-antitoxin stability system